MAEQRRRRRQTRQAKFKLTKTRSADVGLKAVPVLLRASVQDRLRQLAAEGCRAADYALSGDPPWPHLCSIHVDGWRIIVCFPSADEVAVVKVAPHDPVHDPYRELADELGIGVSTAKRTKPPCCDPQGTAPVDAAVVAAVEEGFDRLGARRDR